LKSTHNMKQNSNLLYQGKNSTIESLKGDIVLKKLSHKYPSPPDIQRFRNEFDILQDCEIKGVRKVFHYEKKDDTHILTLEHIKGHSLSDFILQQSLSITEKLHLLVKLSKVVEGIHQAGIIHKDLNINNIIVTPTQDIYIIDFGISSRFTLKQPNLGNPEKLEGTLSYISPEQTGRMNRSIDYRTDLYALGVIFYQILTEKLPFEANDAMSLVYAHLAEKPIPPHEINPKLSFLISDIILKLLRKNPENRYQSLSGLIYDLEKYLTKIQEGETNPTFDLAQNDFSGKLQIPEKLYGREEETKVILESFQRVLNGSVELTLVAGYSGTGKSVLVNETHRPLTSTKGYFIEGKFDQFQHNIPFLAWIQAFENFIDLLLTENEHTLSYWKSIILEALGDNGSVLTEVVPNLETVIGSQPAIPELGGQEAQNRFNYVIQNFIKAITNERHPIIIFIDDLQWADSASLNLLKTLVTDKENTHLLCVGAYRDNEVSTAHPLTSILAEIQNEGRNLNEITVGNLDEKATLKLLSDTLHHIPDEKLETLNEIVLSKTQGNAFFIHQFLKHLYEEEWLYFALEEKKWKWNNIRIKQTEFTDNVVDFMAQKVKTLPKRTKKLIELASCIGNKFDVQTLQIIAPRNDLRTDLKTAILDGFIFPTQLGHYKFVHDRVQQAAYSLLSETEKQQTHLKIGRILYQSLSEEKRKEQVFEIVSHYNLAKNIFTTEDKKIALILNQQAGVKAHKATAYQSTILYLNKSLELLPASHWENYYKQSLLIYEFLVEAYYLRGEFKQMHLMADELIKNTVNLTDQIKTHEICILSHLTRLNPQQSLQIGLEMLAKAGVSMPQNPTPQDIGMAVTETVSLFEGKNIETLLNLPEMKTAQEKITLRLLISIFPSTFVGKPELFPIVVCECVKTSLKYGLIPLSSFAFANFGLLLSAFGYVEKGYFFGEIAEKLINQFDNKIYKTKVLNNTRIFHHLTTPVQETFDKLRVAYQNGLEVGDIEYYGYVVLQYGGNSFLSGENLSQLNNELHLYNQTLLQFKQQNNFNYNEICRQSILNLLGESDHPDLLVGDELDENQLIPLYEKINDVYGLFNIYLFKTILAFMFDNPLASQYGFLTEKNASGGVMGMFIYTSYHFYASLAHLRAYSEVKKEQQTPLWENIEDKKEKLHKWAKTAPSNYLHRYLLIVAEQAKVKERPFQEVLTAYRTAIKSAEESGFTQEIALANELCAQYLIISDMPEYAQVHLTKSYQLYKQWGAITKLGQMEEKYPQLLLINELTLQESYKGTTVGTTTNQVFDANTILKANMSLSQQIRLENLIEEMLYLLTENSGANKIAFLREEEGNWIIEADQENGKNLVIQPILFEDYSNLPHQIISYVLRSQELVLSDDITQESTFRKDPYVQQHQTKSVLVMPVKRKNKLIALLYMENSLNTGVFHQKRSELIKALTTQLAISMENTLLYKNLEYKVQQRTQELQESNEQLQVINEELLQTQEELTAQRDVLVLTNQELEEHQYRIHKSIQSALLIQNSILPISQLFEENFSDHFILYLPKDVVSGDFYWLHIFDTCTKILVEADCTGHGVPGAFMTLISHAVLNRVLLIEQERSPIQIMARIHYHMQKILQQQTTGNLHGMDISILIFQKQERAWQIDFGSAGQKLHFVSPQTGLEIIKGSRRKIGGFNRKKHSFEEHKLFLPKGTMLYLSSDGFIDQNNPERKKFGSKDFAQLLEKIHQDALASQQKQLLEALRNHQQDQQQRDDITVIGVQL